MRRGFHTTACCCFLVFTVAATPGSRAAAARTGGGGEELSSSRYEPTVSRREAALLQEAFELSQSDPSLAIQQLNHHRDARSSAALDFAVGNFYYLQDAMQDAIEAYQVAIEKLPTFRRALNNLARVYLVSDQADKAVAVLQGMLRDGQADGDMLVLLGHGLLLQEQPVSAEGAYRHSLVLQPGSREAMRGLAKCLIDQRRYAEALALTVELLQEEALDEELWALRVQIHLALSQENDALTASETARRMGAAAPSILGTLGDLYINRAQPFEAFRAYEEAFALENAPVMRILLAAEGFMALEAYDRAERMMGRVRALWEIRGTDVPPVEEVAMLHLVARLSLARGQREEARKMFGELVRRDPLDGESLLALGRLEHEEQAYEEARMHYERASRISGFEARARVSQAQLEVDCGRYPQAVTLLESAQVFEPRPHVARYLEQVKRLTL